VTDQMTVADLDEWLERIAERDVEAFGEWMRGAEPRIRASLRSFAAGVDVEAIVQDTLLRVWQVAPRFVADGRPNGLLRLGIRIGRNLAVSELRRRRHETMDIEALERAAAASGLAAVEPGPAPDPLLHQRIEDCVGRLPRQPGRALARRLSSAGSQADAALADGLGMRVNTFLQNIARARKLVAECLERHGIDLVRELA
jgi:DNA-directed RNA polymerase specialized sigma24 family protein